ncbi:MAG: XdhC family protein [Lachnospiraceae bacterium]
MNLYNNIRNGLEQGSESVILISDISADHGECEQLSKSTDLYRISEEERYHILRLGKPVMLKKDERTLFAEPFYTKERILIFGGGHVALPLVKFAKMIGFYVVIYDDRKEFANRERFPLADEVHTGSYKECIEAMKPQASDYIVVITRGHSQDTLCIQELLKYPEPVYTGLIGSRKRTKVVFQKFLDEGQDPQRIQAINSPIGLNIGAQTTEEIGISIMAEIIQRKRMESMDSTVVNRSDMDVNALELLCDARPPFALATIMKAHGSVPRKEGAKMLIFPDGSIQGTIGGGGVEAAIIKKGMELAGTGKYCIYHVDLNGEDAMAQGMVCGGSLEILLEDTET